MSRGSQVDSLVRAGGVDKTLFVRVQVSKSLQCDQLTDRPSCGLRSFNASRLRLSFSAKKKEL